MGIFYCLTAIALIASFMIIKKEDEKQNFITWLVLSVILYLGYNIFICMIFGVLNITTSMLFLSIINIIIIAVMLFFIIKNKTIQKYKVEIKDIIAIVFCFIIVSYVAITQYKPLAKIVANASVDVSMHYSAALNFANNMKVLAKIDNQTGYNFKTMQTGAYINTGILMNVLRTFNFKDYVSFKIFETLIFALSSVAFYVLISDKLKTKMQFILGLIFIGLYSFAFPYTSLLYGFSYLSIAIVFATGLFILANIYGKSKINFYIWTLFILLISTGIIFSYCLFVPALFAFICLYVWFKDFENKEGKVYLKIFKKNFLVLTGILLLLTILSICYLVIPTFTDNDQNKLTDAIGFEGQIYKALYQDFLIYLPFIIIFMYRNIKDRKMDYKTLAFILIFLQIIAELIGLMLGFVSAYYYYKMYYLIWIVSLAITVDVVMTDNKEMFVGAFSIFTIFSFLIYASNTGLELKFQAKAPGLIETYKVPSLVGIYYDTNVLAVGNINVSCLVNTNRIEIAEEMGKISDITLKNMLVGGMNTNCKAWMYVIANIPCGGESINDLQKADVDTSIEDFLENDEKKYFILYDETNNYESNDDYEVVFENKAGVILKKVN